MKKKFFSLIAVMCTVFCFTSCSNNDEPATPGSKFDDKAYTDESGLTLTVNGTPYFGKSVDFKHVDGDKAVVTLAGAPLDLSAIIGGVMSKADNQSAPGFSIPTSGVIPGSPSVEIPVTLVGDADKCTFSGTHETEYATFSYTGAMEGENLNFEVKDLALKNTSMAATYATVSSDYNVFDVFRVVWEADKQILDMPVSSIVGLMPVFTMINNAEGQPESLLSLFPKMLKDVTLGADGSVVATYADTDKEGWPDVTSPKGFADYVVKEDGSILLFVNPANIVTSLVNVASKSRALDINALITGLMTDVVPLIANGIPVCYGPAIVDHEGTVTDDPSNISFYLDEEVLLPILKLASPVLSDQDIVNAIVEAASKDPNMGFMAGMLPGILASLPEVIDTTSKIQIGINVNKM